MGRASISLLLLKFCKTVLSFLPVLSVLAVLFKSHGNRAAQDRLAFTVSAEGRTLRKRQSLFPLRLPVSSGGAKARCGPENKRRKHETDFSIRTSSAQRKRTLAIIRAGIERAGPDAAGQPGAPQRTRDARKHRAGAAAETDGVEGRTIVRLFSAGGSDPGRTGGSA